MAQILCTKSINKPVFRLDPTILAITMYGELVLVATKLSFKTHSVFWSRFSGYTGTDASELGKGSFQHCEPIDKITEIYVSLSLDSQT